MNYDFFAILDQDVPRCRSWVRFMGSEFRVLAFLGGDEVGIISSYLTSS